MDRWMNKQDQWMNRQTDQAHRQISAYHIPSCQGISIIKVEFTQQYLLTEQMKIIKTQTDLNNTVNLIDDIYDTLSNNME